MSHKDKQTPRVVRPGDDALLAIGDRLQTVCDERDDARARLNAMTADRDFVTVQRDTARAMTREVASLDTVPRHAWDGLMADARELRAALVMLAPYAYDTRARAIIDRTDCLTDTDDLPESPRALSARSL